MKSPLSCYKSASFSVKYRQYLFVSLDCLEIIERISTLHFQMTLRIHRSHKYHQHQKKIDSLEEIINEIKADVHITKYILPRKNPFIQVSVTSLL